eukprot:344130_1
MASFGDTFNSNNNNTKHSYNEFTVNETVHYHYCNEAKLEETQNSNSNNEMKQRTIKMDRHSAIRLKKQTKLKKETKVKKETKLKKKKTIKKESRMVIDDDLTESEDENKDVIFQGFKKKDRDNNGDVIYTGYKQNSTKVKYEMK